MENPNEYYPRSYHCPYCGWEGFEHEMNQTRGANAVIVDRIGGLPVWNKGTDIIVMNHCPMCNFKLSQYFKKGKVKHDTRDKR